MQQRNVRIFLLITTIACIYGYYLQLGFLTSYLFEARTQYSHEYLAGVFLVGFFFSIAWLGSFILLTWKKSCFSTTERIVGYIPSSLIVINCLLSVVL